MRRVLLAATLAAATLAAGATSAATLITNPASASSPPLASNDVNITAGDFVTSFDGLTPGSTLEFTYTAVGDVNIGGISVSGTGNNSGDDLEAVRFGTVSANTEFPVVVPSSMTAPNSSAFAGGSLPGLSLLDGQSFTIFWSYPDGPDRADVGVTASFSVTAGGLIPVPLPAGGLLLIGALGALGIARRKV